MPSTAATLVAALTPLGYPGLSDRDLLLVLAGILATLSGLNAVTAVQGAAVSRFAALSDRDLDVLLANALN